MHQDAIERLDGDYLKSQCTINNSTIDANSMGLITKNHCISKDPDYIKIDYNEATEKLYNYIKNKSISTFTEFRNTRHAVVLNTKISKDGRRLQTLDLSDSGGDLNLVISKVKKWIEVTEVRNESFNVVTSAGMGIEKKDKVGYEILCTNGDKKAVTAYLSDTPG